MIFLLSFASYFVAAALMPASVVVQWATANEVNTAGFNIYRSQNRNGPFTKINANLLPASTDPLSGSQYHYEDANVTAGQTYYYNVADVEYAGASTQHGPIVITAPAVWDFSNGLGIWLALGAGFLIVSGMRVYRAQLRK